MRHSAVFWAILGLTALSCAAEPVPQEGGADAGPKEEKEPGAPLGPDGDPITWGQCAGHQEMSLEDPITGEFFDVDIPVYCEEMLYDPGRPDDEELLDNEEESRIYPDETSIDISEEGE